MELFTALLPFWPGFAFMLCVSVVAQVLKTQLFKKEITRRHLSIRWVQKTYPILLLLLGVIPGVLWKGEVMPGVDLMSEKVMFFMGFAAASILMFNIFKQWVKNRLAGEP
jgi:hypothetical protein